MLVRPFTLFCFILATISGMVLYTQKHETTVLDHQIAKIVHDTEKLKARTAMLRTEWTLLNQPDRLKTLANNFLPQLQPLAPTQFVQMTALLTVLPPVQKQQDDDKVRKQLVQMVASNHGQTPKTEEKPKTADKSNHTTVPQDDLPIELTAADDDKSPIPAKTTLKKPVRPITKKKDPEIDLSDAFPEKNNSKPIVKSKTVKKDTNETITATDSFDSSKTDKKNANPPTVTKKALRKPSPHPVFSIADSANSASSVKEKNDLISMNKKETHPATNVSFKPKHSEPLKKTQNKQKQHYHSESAFGDDSDDSLPAPVPFSQ